MADSGKIGASIIRLLTRPLAALPLSFHRRAGRVLGRLAGGLLRYRRDVVITNLARSFPQMGYDELQQVCRSFYEHFGTVFCEALWFGGCRGPRRLRKAGIVRMENQHLLNEMTERGQSICVLASHNGNWALIGGYMSYSPDLELNFSEKEVCVIFRQLSSPAWNRFFSFNRTAALDDPDHYEGMLESFNVLRYALQHKDEPKIYNFITDQYPYTDRGNTEDISFLGQKTCSMNGGAALAHKLGMGVLYMNMAQTPEGNYTMPYTKICDDAREMDTDEKMRQYNLLHDADIRRQPANYLWTHKRWK